jgi:hypothetical protein
MGFTLPAHLIEYRSTVCFSGVAHLKYMCRVLYLNNLAQENR